MQNHTSGLESKSSFGTHIGSLSQYKYGSAWAEAITDSKGPDLTDKGMEAEEEHFWNEDQTLNFGFIHWKITFITLDSLTKLIQITSILVGDRLILQNGFAI